MKIAVISDSHDNLPNIEKFLAWAKKNKIKMIIHCGDIAAPAVVKKVLAPGFKGPIHLIFGNVADRDLLKEVVKELKNVTLDGEVGEVEIDGKRIAFCHYPWLAEKLAKNEKYDFVFYGHDHKPWEKRIGNTVLINPGTLAGMFNKATFAEFDTKTGLAKLILLEKI